MMAFRLDNLKGQRQLQASGGDKPLGVAHAVILVSAPNINCISTALKNLALQHSLNDTTVIQQLMTANLLLRALVTSLMMANKKLTDTLARNKGVALLAVAPSMGGARNKLAFPRKLFLDPRSLG